MLPGTLASQMLDNMSSAQTVCLYKYCFTIIIFVIFIIFNYFFYHYQISNASILSILLERIVYC